MYFGEQAHKDLSIQNGYGPRNNPSNVGLDLDPGGTGRPWRGFPFSILFHVALIVRVSRHPQGPECGQEKTGITSWALILLERDWGDGARIRMCWRSSFNSNKCATLFVFLIRCLAHPWYL